ncbi:MAG: hypothetical protein FJW26_11895 [Acidimicrobiia bacterium]|nr:hypothetical protein [Acidimicrobiia bacterium]
MPTREELQQRLDRISNLFASIVAHADEQSTWRCPYKNRFDRCTAQFGCRNKRKAGAAGELPLCIGDDKLDYRPAWE